MIKTTNTENAMHNELQIIYKNNKPYGIRDKNGFLFFFVDVRKFTNQEERYRKEVEEQFALADYLLTALKARNLTQNEIASVQDKFI